jgi:L-threonylcarbamoyladenylate synthase
MTTHLTRDISKIAEALKFGQTVGIPTETVYGLAANALNEQAVASIFSIKGRPTSNPLILHFYNLEQARPYMEEFQEELYLLEQHFCPGPITFLVAKTPRVPEIITAGLPRVAIRFPSHPMLRTLLAELDFP